MLQLKRLLHTPVYFILTICMFICFLIMKEYSESNTSKTRIGFHITYVDNATQVSVEMTEAARKSLLSYQGQIEFVEYPNLDEMKSQVTKSHMECAYEISSDIIDQLNENNRKNLITVYTGPASTMTDVINQIFYSNIYRQYSFLIMYHYLEKQSFADDYLNPDSFMKLKTLYNRYSGEDATFTFDFTYLNTNNHSLQKKSTHILLIPLECILSILLFMCCLCGLYGFLMENETGFYKALPCSRRLQEFTKHISVYIIPAAFMFFICHILNSEGFISSLFRLLLSSAVLFCFALFIFFLNPKRELFISFIPFYCLASFIFTPVIFDISSLVPGLSFTQFLFIPFYLQKNSNPYYGIAACIVLLVSAFLIKKKKHI